VARVGCALCQVAGFPARIVYLVDTEKAYSGHVIIEVYRAKVWGAVDPLTNVIYRHPGGEPASTWDLINNPRLIQSHSIGKSTPYTVVASSEERQSQTISYGVGGSITTLRVESMITIVPFLR